MPSNNLNKKVVIRRLPPQLPRNIFEETIKPWKSVIAQVNYDPGAAGISYCIKTSSGQIKKQKPYSRAYLTFKTVEDLLQFSQSYNGWKFVGKSGEQHHALVEFAPSQMHCPDQHVLKDPICNTFLQDSAYQTYLKRLESTSNINVEEQTSSAMPADNTNITPLLEYLTQKKQVKLLKKKSESKEKQGKKSKKQKDKVEDKPLEQQQLQTRNKNRPKKNKKKKQSGVGQNDLQTFQQKNQSSKDIPKAAALSSTTANPTIINDQAKQTSAINRKKGKKAGETSESSAKPDKSQKPPKRRYYSNKKSS